MHAQHLQHAVPVEEAELGARNPTLAPSLPPYTGRGHPYLDVVSGASRQLSRLTRRGTSAAGMQIKVSMMNIN